jgi:hypothetical protein
LEIVVFVFLAALAVVLVALVVVSLFITIMKRVTPTKIRIATN